MKTKSIKTKALPCERCEIRFVICCVLFCLDFFPVKCKPIGLGTEGTCIFFSRVQIPKISDMVWKLNTSYLFKGMKKALCGWFSSELVAFVLLVSIRLEQNGGIPSFRDSPVFWYLFFPLSFVSTDHKAPCPSPVLEGMMKTWACHLVHWVSEQSAVEKEL